MNIKLLPNLIQKRLMKQKLKLQTHHKNIHIQKHKKHPLVTKLKPFLKQKLHLKLILKKLIPMNLKLTTQKEIPKHKHKLIHQLKTLLNLILMKSHKLKQFQKLKHLKLNLLTKLKLDHPSAPEEDYMRTDSANTSPHRRSDTYALALSLAGTK